ncbi:MAG: hypothetical protein RLN62_00830 [Rickettsiales bacterium]
MFGISLNEFFVVLIVAVLFIRPKDISDGAKSYKKYINSFRKVKKHAEEFFVDLHNKAIEIDSEDSKTDSPPLSESEHDGYVLDSEGKMYKSYNISEFKN